MDVPSKILTVGSCPTISHPCIKDCEKINFINLYSNLLTEQDAELVEKAKEILNKHRQEFQENYGVDQLGVGYKITGGKVTDQVALIFYVKDKKKKEDLSSDKIPEEIEGIPTDVVAIPKGFRPR